MAWAVGLVLMRPDTRRRRLTSSRKAGDVVTLFKRLRIRFGRVASPIDHAESKDERLQPRDDRLFGSRGSDFWLAPPGDVYRKDDRPRH